MKHSSLRSAVALATLVLVVGSQASTHVTAAERPSSRPVPSADGPRPGGAALDAVPMAFEPNVGQTDARVKYLARGRGYTAFLTATELTLSLVARTGGDAVRMRMTGRAPGRSRPPRSCRAGART